MFASHLWVLKDKFALGGVFISQSTNELQRSLFSFPRAISLHPDFGSGHFYFRTN